MVVLSQHSKNAGIRLLIFLMEKTYPSIFRRVGIGGPYSNVVKSAGIGHL